MMNYEQLLVRRLRDSITNNIAQFFELFFYYFRKSSIAATLEERNIVRHLICSHRIS